MMSSVPIADLGGNIFGHTIYLAIRRYVGGGVESPPPPKKYNGFTVCIKCNVVFCFFFSLQVLEALDRLATFQMAFGIENFRCLCFILSKFGIFTLKQLIIVIQ